MNVTKAEKYDREAMACQQPENSSIKACRT